MAFPSVSERRPRPLIQDRKKAMEYNILTHINMDTLIEQVNDAIKCGWEPLGGLAMASANRWAQAMIRRK